MKFNPKSINSIAFYRALTPESKGEITIAQVSGGSSDGYTAGTITATLFYLGECFGVKLDDRNPGFDRDIPGSSDKLIYRCLIESTDRTRQIQSGMAVKIDRTDGQQIIGVIDLVEFRVTNAIRLYVDCSQQPGINWKAIG